MVEILDDISEANMYLAEDRILCLEIYTKKKELVSTRIST